MERYRSEFEEFAVAATPALLRSAFLLTGDQQYAEDLVQTALARTHRHWTRINDPAAYARRVMYRQRVDFWRKRRVTESFSDRPTDHPVVDATTEIDLRLSLLHSLSKLPAKQRAVIVLRFFEDRTVTDTAFLLGISEGTVKTHTFRALDRLRDLLPGLINLVNGGE